MTPSPVIWGWALATPIIFFVPVWWPYWIMHALAIYSIGHWLFMRWKIKIGL